MPSPLHLDVHAPIDLRFGTTDVRLEPLSEAGQAPDWDALAQRWSAAHPGDDAVPARDLDEDPVLHLPILLNRLRTETFEPRALTPWLQAATAGLIKSFNDQSSDPEEQDEARLRWTNHLMAQETTIALLLAHGAQPDPYVVSQVILNGNPRLLQRVLDGGGARLDWSAHGLADTYDRVARHVMEVPRHMRAAAAQSAYAVSPLIATMYQTLQSGALTMARMMLDAGTPADLVDPANGNTALHWAAAMGRAGIAQMLVERGADLQARNQQGHTPMHLAAYANAADVIDVLHAHGARLDEATPAIQQRSVVSAAARPSSALGKAPSLGQALPEDLDPDTVVMPNTPAPPGPFRDTPVVQAAHHGSVLALNRLLDLGVNPCPPLDSTNPASPPDERVLRVLRKVHRDAVDSGSTVRATSLEALRLRIESQLLRQTVNEVLIEPPSNRPGRRL